jgi:glycosyltransferase involved in cell wall biosynthesis
MGIRSILFVSADSIYPDTVGGMEVRGRDLSAALATQASVTVVSAPAAKSPSASITNPWFGNTPSARVTWAKDHVSWSMASAAEIRMARVHVQRLLDRTAPDLIYLNKIDRFAPTVVHALLSAGTPVVGYLGDRHQGYTLKTILDGSWLRSLPPRVRALGGLTRLPSNVRDRLFCVFNCQFLRRHYGDTLSASDRQAVIYEGLDIDTFAPGAVPVERPRFVFVGRATPQKGFLDFCETMAALPAELVDAIDIIGEGPAMAKGLSILRQSGRDRLVVGSGACRREDVPARLRRSSILLLPSFDEGLPRVVVEAMACGLCVIASRVGGVPELIQDGDTGFTHRPGDVHMLTTHARQVAASVELRRSLGERARAFAVAQHERSRWLKRTLDVVLHCGMALPTGGASTISVPA